MVGVVNVIPEFPQQSHESQVIAERFHEPAQAHVMSLKSALLTETVHAVIVLAVQIVFDSIKRRFVTELPFNVNVPDIV